MSKDRSHTAKDGLTLTSPSPRSATLTLEMDLMGNQMILRFSDHYINMWTAASGGNILFTGLVYT